MTEREIILNQMVSDLLEESENVIAFLLSLKASPETKEGKLYTSVWDTVQRIKTEREHLGIK